MSNFSDKSFDLILFVVFLLCVPIMVIAVQTKNLMEHQDFESVNLLRPVFTDQSMFDQSIKLV